MDNEDQRAADVEELARAVGAGAAELRAWMRAARRRHRHDAVRTRALIDRATRPHERPSRPQAQQQAEVDHEARCSARRMADRAEPAPPIHAVWG